MRRLTQVLNFVGVDGRADLLLASVALDEGLELEFDRVQIHGGADLVGLVFELAFLVVVQHLVVLLGVGDHAPLDHLAHVLLGRVDDCQPREPAPQPAHLTKTQNDFFTKKK